MVDAPVRSARSERGRAWSVPERLRSWGGEPSYCRAESGILGAVGEAGAICGRMGEKIQ